MPKKDVKLSQEVKGNGKKKKKKSLPKLRKRIKHLLNRMKKNWRVLSKQSSQNWTSGKRKKERFPKVWKRFVFSHPPLIRKRNLTRKT